MVHLYDIGLKRKRKRTRKRKIKGEGEKAPDASEHRLLRFVVHEYCATEGAALSTPEHSIRGSRRSGTQKPSFKCSGVQKTRLSFERFGAQNTRFEALRSTLRSTVYAFL